MVPEDDVEETRLTSVHFRVMYDQPLYVNGARSFQHIHNYGHTEDVDRTLHGTSHSSTVQSETTGPGSLELCCSKICYISGGERPRRRSQVETPNSANTDYVFFLPAPMNPSALSGARNFVRYIHQSKAGRSYNAHSGPFLTTRHTATSCRRCG